MSALHDHHRAMLCEESGIRADVIAARGYETVTTKTELRQRGFSPAQQNVPALLIPIFSPTGDVVLYQARPDTPRIAKGKPVKYETPSGSAMRLDVPPASQDRINNPKVPLFITEGVKKVDALVSRGLCAVGLIGVWNWRGRNEHGGKTALPEWEDLALNGRQVYIVFDSDVMTKKEVHAALARFAPFLKHKGAKVAFIYLSVGDGATKQGVDDYLAAGHSVDDLLALATSEVREIEGETENGKEPRKSQSTELGELVTASGAELFHTPDDEPFVTVTVDDHLETYRLKSKGARGWFRRLYRAETSKSIGGQALQDALNDLEGVALFDGEKHEVYVRLAWHNGDIILDLGNDTHQVVRITKSGFHLEAHSPVKFVRPKALAALPVPNTSGNISELWGLLNVNPEDRPLVTAWLVAALRPTGPYPALALHGEQGSAKSTTARALRALVDPSTAPLRSEPKDSRDLMIAATSSWVPTFDNLSSISPSLSDALCILSTGGGYATRTLFENDEETILSAQRPVIMTAISDIATRPDLLDRCIILYLPRIKDDQRRPESAFWKAFDAAHGRILGALLMAVATGLKEVDNVKLDELPRMADFAIWAVACERTLGLESDSFLNRYGANRADANELALDTSPLPQVLRAFLEAQGGAWQGSASELLNGLTDHLEKERDERTPKSREWPKRADKLSGTLRRYAPNLRATGLEIDFERNRTQRFISLRTAEENSVTAVTGVTIIEKHRQGRHVTGDATGDAKKPSSVTLQPSVTSSVTPQTPSETTENLIDDARDARDAESPSTSKWSGMDI